MSKTILGLDLGPNSIGWALLKTTRNKPSGIIDVGVRVFEAGLQDLEADGKGKSRNAARREARQVRRGLERRSRRLSRLANVLKGLGLLPTENYSDSQTRHRVFTELDRGLDNPYQLRARALNEKLTPVEVGRVLYHLGHRRGFLSNRKAPIKKDEDAGAVKSGISKLQSDIANAGARTLGEYFSTLDPHQERIRKRYTHRQMYMDEFEAIWQAQSIYHPQILTNDTKKMVHRAIFYQRPLKNQKHLIGNCELEPKYKRAPWALLSSQRFRYLQLINNLRLVSTETGEEVQLNIDQRQLLVETLETKGELTFAAVRRLLGLRRTSKFNLELGGEPRIPGNRTAARLIPVFGLDRWESMSDSDRDSVVHDWRSIVSPDTLKRRAMSVWGLDDDASKAFCEVSLEDGHCSFSRQAIAKLLPLLAKGISLQTAIRELYPERWERTIEPLDSLPPVRSDVFGDLRNPIVERTLSEVRRLVNAIIREYGKPDCIRVELARELKQSAKRRAETTKSNRVNQKEREKAAARILDEVGLKSVSRDDVLKVILAEECNWECPYTGKAISMSDLVGDFPQFDIEHIIPFHRCLDDFFMNKTLCFAEENRNVKQNKGPREAYEGSDRWDDILGRVRRFKGKGRQAKLRRFMYSSEDIQASLENFTSRQLNDTAYASNRAKEYLGLLYGGLSGDGIDAEGKRRVQASAGRATAFLRNEWGLNGILKDGPGKSRDDHRHHAVDAFVMALTNSAMLRQLSLAASRASLEHHRRFSNIEVPWEGFDTEIRQAISKIIVSHRLDRRVRGPLHEQTFYGRPHVGADGKHYIHIRRSVDQLSQKELKSIVDPVIKDAVTKKLAELGQKDPKKAFADPENHPQIVGGDGIARPIHRIRVKNVLATFPIGKDHRLRNVKSERNHHVEVIELLDEKGNVTGWDGVVISLYEAQRRLDRNEEIVGKDHGPGKCFLFSLAGGDIIELDCKDGSRGLFVIRTVAMSKQVRWVPVADARPLAEIGKAGYTATPNSLRSKDCRKVTIDRLGRVRRARD